MKFAIADGTSFTLTVVGYQYPHLATEPYDSNWLRISIDATNAHGSWSVTDPCLLTYEVSHLADWFDAVAAGTVKQATCSFIEPCLLFQLDKDAVGAQELRIYLELELRPPWAHATSAGQVDLWLTFPCSQIDMHAAAIMLRRELKQYPQRANR